MTQADVVIIGAGAAGLMCAIEAAKRGRKVLVLEHGKKPGRKILIAGGGRCNFTNMYTEPDNFLCQNPHFVKSALARYTQWDFIGLISDYQIPNFEKKLGQLFCEDSAHDILNMLLKECEKHGASIRLRCEISNIEATDNGYLVQNNLGDIECENVVLATGGLSMPKLGATPFGYQIAEQFGHTIIPTRAGLVPFTYNEQQKQTYEGLSGMSMDSTATSEDGTSFRENLLFTHRGISGPSSLQISSFWRETQTLVYNLNVDNCFSEPFEQAINEHPKQELKTVLNRILPKRFVEVEWQKWVIDNKQVGQLSKAEKQSLIDALEKWTFKPNGTEGYRTAEVTLGGVDTDEISSKTMESKLQKGLYFIGEVMDVTGWLGGYNFQWAWSSGWVAGQEV